MSFPQSKPPIPMTIPVLGMNTRDALAYMDPRYCPWLLNFEPENQFVRLRGGWSVHATLSDEETIRELVAYGESNLFAYASDSSNNQNIYDVTSSGSQAQAAAVHTPSGTGANPRVSQARYAGRCGFVCNNNSSTFNAVYDGSSWGAPGFTYSASPITSYVYTSYRGRVYLFHQNYLYYSALDAVTGACSRVDMQPVMDLAGDIIWAATLSNPRELEAEQLICFGNTEGEILVYAGDSPEADNWAQVAHFKVGRPIIWQGVLEYQNDVWVMTENGIVSIRRLMTSTSDNFEGYTVTAMNTPYWTQLISFVKDGASTIYGSLASITAWPVKNKVYALVNGHVDADGTFVAIGTGCTMFVCNLTTGGWAIHEFETAVGASNWSMVYFDNALYRASGKYVLKYDLDSFKDEDMDNIGNYESISYELQSAYVDFGSANKHKHVVGFEPIMETDFADSNVTMKGAFDFGRVVTEAVQAELEDGFNNPLFRTGNEGTFAQYRLLGDSDTSSTDGLKLYSVGACMK